MTTKKQTTKKAPVVKTTTNVAIKATEQIKKPTIKSLQDEATNLTQQLVYANNKVLELEGKTQRLVDIIAEQDNTPWTTITYQRFVRWLANVTSYFKE